MPVVVSPAIRRTRLALLALPVLSLCAVGLWHEPEPLYDDACLRKPGSLVICAASDMARISRKGVSRLEHPRFDLRPGNSRQLHWVVARNETISFQLILRSEDRDNANRVTIDTGSGDIRVSHYLANYVQIRNGAYHWGPATAVLPFPAAYPDALIPSKHGCAQPPATVFDSVELPHPDANQSVWFDMYIPDQLAVGDHRRKIIITPHRADGEQATSAEPIELEIRLSVIDATIPHATSFDAVGEVYRSYRLEGVGEDRSRKQWQQMSQCYQTLAHQHRLVFIERTPDTPQSAQQWQDYVNTYAPAISGELFSAASGYLGTGMDTGVGIWRTPWPQDYDITVDAALKEPQLSQFVHMADRWSQVVEANDWQDTRYFAYVFDEVDGPSGESETDPARHQYISRVHGDMEAVQQAIDAGTRSNGPDAPQIDLLWTSHSDPSIWKDDPATTLEGRVRLWAPNAHAANPGFLQQRINAGEQAWFYHSGHPAVGGHSINLPGSDMRSWGVIGARYGLQGQLMWSVNLGSDKLPFRQPSYKPDDDRVGNGVMVYPGNQLPRIGFAASPGPLPSMRLKAWYRGLQDAELYLMARQRHPEQAEALIRRLIPQALGEAVANGATQPAWPRDAASWMQWRDDLLSLLQTD